MGSIGCSAFGWHASGIGSAAVAPAAAACSPASASRMLPAMVLRVAMAVAICGSAIFGGRATGSLDAQGMLHRRPDTN
jgi:hypothetical protein